MTCLLIVCTVPMKKEIRKAIMELTTGPDDIPAEVLKVDIETFVDMLYPLFMKIWAKNEVPTELKKGCLIKLPEKEISVCVQTTGV